jgi:hypothetical protein
MSYEFFATEFLEKTASLVIRGPATTGLSPMHQPSPMVIPGGDGFHHPAIDEVRRLSGQVPTTRTLRPGQSTYLPDFNTKIEAAPGKPKAVAGRALIPKPRARGDATITRYNQLQPA